MTSTTDDTDPGELAGQFRAAGDQGRALDAERMLESLNAKLFAAERTLSVGRFEVRDRLGAGGMGVVMSAFDPQLHRTVAVKVLRDEGDPSEHRRLLEEARAMAKVRHPNLVTVFEAGTHDDSVFIAMEYVEGGTLGTWLEASPRSWKEIVRVFVGAARGLAAIHEAGMVHRDFKPDNVLVGEDGRPQVSDFGLTRPQSAEMSSTQLEVSEDGDPVATRTRGMTGTPNYLAPEQWKGQGADAASDQWSFFVALHEALYGQRPFEGRSAPSLCAAVVQGKRTPLPDGAVSLPTWLERAIERGLADDPSGRHASMAEVAGLLEAGIEDRRGKMVRVAAFASAGAALLATTAAVLLDRPETCVGVDARLAESWTPQRKAELRETFAAASGAQAWSRIEASLDERVEAWAAQRRDACEATHVRGEQSEDALDLRMRCLERRAVEVESLLATFDDVEEGRLAEAARSVQVLPSLELCADLEFLRMSRPTPEVPEQREAVAELRVRSERLSARIRAGNSKDSAPQVEQLLEDAEALDYEPVLAEAKVLAAKLAGMSGDSERAAELSEQAFEHALATQHVEVQVWAAVVLVFQHGSRGDVEEAERWGRQARALLRAQPYFPTAERALEANLGAAKFRAGDQDAARAHWENAVKMWSNDGLADSIDVIGIEGNLGILLRKQGKLDEAAGRLASARDKAVLVLGSGHPLVGKLGNSLAMTYAALGRDEDAEALYRESIVQLERRLGPDAAAVGHPLNNLAEVLVRRGQRKEALALFDRVIDMWGRDVASNPQIVEPLLNRAELLIAGDRLEQARADTERAQDLLPETASPEQRARLLILHARALERTDPAYAKRLADQAIALEPSDPRVTAQIEAWTASRAASR